MRNAMTTYGWIGVLASATVLTAAEKSPSCDAGPFVRALWAVQRYGTRDAADPRHDERTKATLAASLDKEGTLTTRAVERKLMDEKTFKTLAGDGNRLDSSTLQRVLKRDLPPTRRHLLPILAYHLDALTTSFDRIDAAHLAAGEKLAAWIVSNYEQGKMLPIMFICTGNSRRSILGATMGNAAADYWGLPEVRCYSGGTAPSAFNSRTIATLKAVGVEVEPTGDEVSRGLEAAANPVYRVRWGASGEPGEAAMETLEFSKHYSDPVNPQSGFAALMVCSQADQECPAVAGAAIRIPMPYLDPKMYDDSPYESDKYAERRDDLGRLMLTVMLKARRQLEAAGKPH